MNIFTEYYNGYTWEVLSDNSTTFLIDDFKLEQFTGNLDSGETEIIDSSNITSGKGSVKLKAPGEGNDGTVDVLLKDTAPFFSWLNDIFDNESTGTVTFGIYRGNDKIIYRVEVPVK